MKIFIGDYGPGRIKAVSIDPWDTYSLDQTLALVILPALKAFREHTGGVPSCVCYEKGKEISFTKAKAKWLAILDDMIFAFKCAASDNEYSEPFFSEKNKVLKNGFDSQGLKRCEKRIDKGLKLFAKYYSSLWT